MSESHPDLNVTEARQGRRGRHVLWILIISLALVTIGFAIVWALNAGDLGRADGSKEVEPAVAEAFSAPEQSVKQTDSGPPPSAAASEAPANP